MTTKKFDNLNNEEQEFVLRSYLKGAIHAIVIPAILYVVINILFEGNYGGLMALLYISVLSIAYQTRDDKYFSKRGFYYALGFVGFWVVLYLFMISLAAFVA